MKFRLKNLLILIPLALSLEACMPKAAPEPTTLTSGSSEGGGEPSQEMGMMDDHVMGAQNSRHTGMHERHMARIPGEYAGKRNPIPADESALARGQELYTFRPAETAAQ